MEEVLYLVCIEYKATPSAMCSDASGEALKARDMLAAKYLELVIPDCFMHQESNKIMYMYTDVNHVNRSTLLLEIISRQRHIFSFMQTMQIN